MNGVDWCQWCAMWCPWCRMNGVDFINASPCPECVCGMVWNMVSMVSNEWMMSISVNGVQCGVHGVDEWCRFYV